MRPFSDELRNQENDRLRIQRRRLYEHWCLQHVLRNPLVEICIELDRQESRANLLAIHLRMRTPAEFLTKYFSLNFN